ALRWPKTGRAWRVGPRRKRDSKIHEQIQIAPSARASLPPAGFFLSGNGGIQNSALFESHEMRGFMRMHRHHNLPLAALLMLMMVKTAPLLRQPFSKCCAFHDYPPCRWVNSGLGELSGVCGVRRLARVSHKDRSGPDDRDAEPIRNCEPFAQERHPKRRDQNNAQFVYRCDTCGVAEFERAEVANPRAADSESRKHQEER